MRLPLPRSLKGQTLAILAFTLLISHLIGVSIYSIDRRATVVAAEGRDFADRIVGMVNLVRHLPPGWRDDIVRESDGRTFHVTLDAVPEEPGKDLEPDLSREIARGLADQLPELSPQRIRVSFTATPFVPRVKPGENPQSAAAGVAAGAGENEDARLFLHISVRLGAEGWLNFVGGMPDADIHWLVPATGYVLSVAIGVGIVAMWLVFRVTAPLTAFAGAVDRLGKDLRTEPLPETGPTDVVKASRAFNAMQHRVRRLVENRTQILGALSHDLKTPVTLLRLRAEMMSDTPEREKILGTLDDMEAMVASVLEFTRATLLDEPQARVDLTALLASLCEDMADAGLPVTFEPSGAPVSYVCRRVGLTRALVNLIDNAVKYGAAARVRLERQDGAIIVEIDDDGLGVPEDRQEDIFMPFCRIDESRSVEAGGAGLGLTIAQTIVHGHGGRIEIQNRTEGGLRVRVSLPV